MFPFSTLVDSLCRKVEHTCLSSYSVSSHYTSFFCQAYVRNIDGLNQALFGMIYGEREMEREMEKKERERERDREREKDVY